MPEKTSENISDNNDKTILFPLFCWRIIAMHMLAYFIAAVFAQLTFDYKSLLKSETLSLIMRPWESPLVALGPFLQSINGFFMVLILYRIRHSIINEKNGWITLFLIVSGFSIFAPQAPAPGSFEGFIYTKLPIKEHLVGLPECLFYSFLFSFGLYNWYKRPKRLWNVLTITGLSIISLISLLGFLSSIGILRQS
jgi:hypothetical protein